MTETIIQETIVTRLEDALQACGLPLSLTPATIDFLGEGAWHEAYAVRAPYQAHPLVVRIRKPVAYGRPQPYDEAGWNAEYLSTSLYYLRANRIVAGICPDVYLYHVSEGLNCTVESYMGHPLALADLSQKRARKIGEQMGVFMRKMHKQTNHVPGCGELLWDGAKLVGAEAADAAFEPYQYAYDTIFEANLLANRDGFAERYRKAQDLRANLEEPIVLVNRDVTPENLVIQADGRLGVIDPYPYLGNGTRYAAWAVHCYRFLLPTYAAAERYVDHRYDLHQDTLSALAAGLEHAYTGRQKSLQRQIAAERWLWVLRQVADDLLRLQAPLSDSVIIKHGDTQIIEERIEQGLTTLQAITF